MKNAKLSVSIVVKCVVLWVPLFLCLPFVLAPLLLLSIYKAMVIFLCKLFRRQDIIRPVGGIDVFFSTDDFYRRPYGNVGFVWIVDGSLSPDVIMNRLKNALVPPTTWGTTGNNVQEDQESNNRKKKGAGGYEKLTSVVPEFWMGYPFWRKASPFDIGKHVKIMEASKEGFIQADDINKMICEWMLEPFTQGRPLWEIRLLPDISFSSKILPDLLWPSTSVRVLASGEQQHRHQQQQCWSPQAERQDKREGDEAYGDCKVKSILILKAHHILGDGYSMTGLLSKIIDPPKEPEQPGYFEARHKEGNLKSMQQRSKKEVERVFRKDHRANRIFSVVQGAWCKLSNALQLAFLTPLTLACLVHQFGIHRDCWFTQKKQSDRLNWATVCISMEKLNEIKKDLCETLVDFASTTCHSMAHYNGNGCRDNSRGGSDSKNVRPIQVPVVVILVSAIAGALRKLMLMPTSTAAKMGKVGKEHERESKDYFVCDDYYVGGGKSVTRITSEEIPSSTNFVIALPLQKGHPGSTTFCNFWTQGIVSVNMKEPSSLRRLSLLNAAYWEMQSQRTPEIFHSLVHLVVTLLPQPVLRLMSGFNMGVSIGVTNLAGQSDCAFIGGQRVSHKYGYCGLLWKHASLTLASFSYNGELTVSVLANEDVIEDSASVQKLLGQYFLEELESLRRSRSGSGKET